MSKPGLVFRHPETRWMIIAVIAALCLHGLCWLMGRLFAGDMQGAFVETQRQMALALAWMIGVMFMWKINPPASRLHAVMNIMMCVLFVCALGSAVAIAKNVIAAPSAVRSNLLVFGVPIALAVAQMILAIPSAMLLQGLALTRARPSEG